MKVVSPETLEEEGQYLRLCVYGEPGTGKTWFGASASFNSETTAPVMYLEYRAQIASLRSNPKFVDAIKDGRLVILTLEDYNELNHVYTWLRQGPGSMESFDNLFPNRPPKTVVVDSLTELQRAEVMLRAGNKAGQFIRNVEPPQIQHWGSLLNQFTLLAHLFYQLPYHIVFVGLESVDYGTRVVGQTPKITGYRIAMQGQAQRQFPAYALTLMRLERAARNSPAFAVGHTSSVMMKTKEQTGMIPAQILAPTIPMLVEMLRGDEKDDS